MGGPFRSHEKILNSAYLFIGVSRALGRLEAPWHLHAVFPYSPPRRLDYLCHKARIGDCRVPWARDTIQHLKGGEVQ